MIYRRSLIAVTAIALSLSLHGVALAQGSPEAPVKSLPFLSPIFGDNMVMQRGKPNIVWGWSEPGDHVPIGLLVDALGGTPAEAWTSPEALRPLNDFDVPLAELEKMTAAGAPEYGNYVMHWYDQYDVGLKGNWLVRILMIHPGSWLTFWVVSPNWACPRCPLWSGSEKKLCCRKLLRRESA